MLDKVSKDAGEVTPGLKLFFDRNQILDYDKTLLECGLLENSIIEYSYFVDMDYIQAQHAEGYWTVGFLNMINLCPFKIIKIIPSSRSLKIYTIKRLPRILDLVRNIKSLKN